MFLKFSKHATQHRGLFRVLLWEQKHVKLTTKLNYIKSALMKFKICIGFNVYFVKSMKMCKKQVYKAKKNPQIKNI